MSLILIGPTRTGKTEWARSLGVHTYWNGYYDLKTIVKNSEYAIFDDIPWERVPVPKAFFGAQKEFTMTDKYCKKQTIKWGKPSIYISNEKPDIVYDEWYKQNCKIIEIHKPLF